MKTYKDFLKEINRDELYQIYIIENKPYSYLLEKYNIKPSTLDRVLKELDIHKTRSQSSKLVQETKYKKYGSKENYNKIVREKIKNTITEKDGSLEAHYKTVGNKVKETKIKRYGTSHIYNNEKCIKTCQERYGVNYPCQRKEARDASSNDSGPNKEFEKLLQENNLKYEREFHLGSKSYNFKVDNTLIEINPSAIHNSTWKPFGDHKGLDSNYHFNKTLLANENNYRCIHIWDWDDKEKIIESLKPKKVIYARNCLIKEVSEKDTNEFLNLYHFQNTCSKQLIRLGLYYEDELVEIITFGKPRYNKNYEYELLRLCSKYKVVGGCEKLFKYFLDNYKPNSIISYCDNSKFKGEVYIRLGFKLKTFGKPTKHWYNLRTKKHITDNLLRQRGFDQLFGKEYGFYGKGSSNEDLMIDHKFIEIYDSGQSVYIYKI